jgi:hypothetical protein
MPPDKGGVTGGIVMLQDTIVPLFFFQPFPANGVLQTFQNFDLKRGIRHLPYRGNLQPPRFYRKRGYLDATEFWELFDPSSSSGEIQERKCQDILHKYIYYIDITNYHRTRTSRIDL